MARLVLTLTAAPDAPAPLPPDGDEALFAGLRALADSAFPKSCRNCGQTFADAGEYVRLTEKVAGGASGFKQSLDEDGSHILELFRNCHGGSTLMDCFSDRRDASEAGLARRDKFGALLELLTARGLDRELARGELLKLMRGEPSRLLRVVAR